MAARESRAASHEARLAEDAARLTQRWAELRTREEAHFGVALLQRWPLSDGGRAAARPHAARVAQAATATQQEAAWAAID